MRELLAPAGDLERLRIAFLYGADAVYIGGRNFSLRANATNFSNDEIKEAAEIAHSLNKLLYVTVNIVFHNEDISGIDDYLIFLNSIKVDGVIVSDIFILNKIKELNLDLFVILSTQASVLNHYAVKFYQNLGVKRIVLAREASKLDIEKIITETGIEVETFIHGAMCINLSGKCILSNITTNRDANRGGCAQVCRWKFENSIKPDFTMMSKDLNMVNNLKELFNLGVVSYKVEGRMRSIYYIASIISVYRKIFDKLLNNEELNEEFIAEKLRILNRVSNRESKDQFFSRKTNYNDQYFNDSFEMTNKDFLGIVTSYDKEKKLINLEQRNYFKLGDNVEFITPSGDIYQFKIEKMYDKDGTLIEIANHPQMLVEIEFDKDLAKYSMMRKKEFDKE